MDDCVECASKLGKRMGEELGLPVYLYEHASRKEERRKLPDVRQKMMGEYEGVEENIGKEGNEPDYGPAEFVPSWGATAVGAR